MTANPSPTERIRELKPNLTSIHGTMYAARMERNWDLVDQAMEELGTILAAWTFKRALDSTDRARQALLERAEAAEAKIAALTAAIDEARSPYSNCVTISLLVIDAALAAGKEDANGK
jgi:hypothetical protein